MNEARREKHIAGTAKKQFGILILRRECKSLHAKGPKCPQRKSRQSFTNAYFAHQPFFYGPKAVLTPRNRKKSGVVELCDYWYNSKKV